MFKDNNSGFTMVEIVVGLATMAIFTLSITVVITNLNAINDRARDLVTTNGIAEKKVEALRSADFVALTDGTVDFTSELPNSLAAPRSAEYTLSTVSAPLKKVEVEISYTVGNQQKTQWYTSYIGELGIGQ